MFGCNFFPWRAFRSETHGHLMMNRFPTWRPKSGDSAERPPNRRTNDFGGNIGEFTPLPRLHLFVHGLEIPLHAVDTERNAIDQRERLRVLGQHRCDTPGQCFQVRYPLKCDFPEPTYGPCGCAWFNFRAGRNQEFYDRFTQADLQLPIRFG